jgi:hypothetical protein
MIKKLILDKVRWARGDTPNIQLLNDSGKLCCLGVCMAQEGVSPQQLLNVGEVHEPYRYSDDPLNERVIDYLVDKTIDFVEDEDTGEEIEEAEFEDRPIAGYAIDINDSRDTNDEEKVNKLNELFSVIGIEVVLVDTPEEAAALGGLPVDFAKDLS